MIDEKDFEAVINARFTAPVYSRLKAARIGIAGLGGLGSHIAAALARCGTGYLCIADFDTVELSNLNRQMYTAQDIGRRKTEATADKLKQINPFINIVQHHIRITDENAADIFSGCDIVCEAFDVPESKAMLVNTILTRCPDKYVIASSGLAGFADGNTIKTRKITDRFILCGDGENGIENGIGLTAPRVMICAGHAALAAVRIILEESLEELK